MTVTVEGPAPQQPQLLRSADTPLGRARVARGWSQDKAVRALILLAESWGWQIASESSLKVQFSRWEHDATRPGETYRVLLCAIYRTTPDALGFNRPRTDKPATTSKSLRERVGELEALVERLSGYLGAVEGVQA
ncbi:XRE family transcriptional regulator [Streptomyces bobili]|uniref:XRE family transcriptional regulator n=1 Tax=Streptomyces bobili TaxID=67280 RepID=A0ABZ1R1F0_9ACTN|nr:XRE family transcriptional regulator [Streptomyces bobili]